MIKTVSFAPSRAARATNSPIKSSVKTANINANARAANSAAPAKPASIKTQTPVPSEKKAVAALVTNTPTTAVAEAKSPLAPKRARATRVATKDEMGEQMQMELPVVAEHKLVESVSETTEKVGAKVSTESDSTPEKVALKVKKSRAPKDLAAQYGGAAGTEDVPRHVVEIAAPRKRLTRAKKEARSQLLRADDEVLQRLQQANVIAAKKPEKRGRGWEFECGCCGRVTRFQTPGALCECGAIAVRE